MKGLGFVRRLMLGHDKWTFEEGRRISPGPTVFLHIPKSAGTAFCHCLSEALNAPSTTGGFDHSLFGGFTEFETISTDAARIFGPSDPLPPSASFVSGHFAVSTSKQNFPAANYCTVLREPVSRLLSHWLYWRQFGDEDLAGWGPIWSERVFRARQPLIDFLRDPDIACQTDNVATRMLLWPDPRAPKNGFIKPRGDRTLRVDALATLQDFDFVDYLENPEMARNVSDWIGEPFVLKRLNETRRAYERFPVELERELTREAHALLEERSRLDVVLWRKIVERRSPSTDFQALRSRILRETVERQKALQTGGLSLPDRHS